MSITAHNSEAHGIVMPCGRRKIKPIMCQKAPVSTQSATGQQKCHMFWFVMKISQDMASVLCLLAKAADRAEM
jgi:hypothetical protein